MKRRDHEIGLLDELPIFRPLAFPVIELLADRLEGLTVAAGDYVVTQGDDGDRFYVIEHGTARVVWDGAARPDLVDGDCFGEIALLLDVPRTASVIATTTLRMHTLSATTSSPPSPVRRRAGRPPTASLPSGSTPTQRRCIDFARLACVGVGSLDSEVELAQFVDHRRDEGTGPAVLVLRDIMFGNRRHLRLAETSCRSQSPAAREAAMSQVRVHNFSISLDGFGTGDGITSDAPFGHAGERLHEWMFATRFWRSMVGEPGGTVGVDHAFAERHGPGIGAEIMGRGKFGVQTGPWTDVGADDEWRGWWGPNPPFHTPVFVLTHHQRPSIEMEGGTVFHFVDANPQKALDLAREAAGDLDVRIGGGPTVVRDFLAANLVDTLHVVQVPILLGRGMRLWDGLEGVEERYDIEAVSSPSGVTHLTFTRR